MNEEKFKMFVQDVINKLKGIITKRFAKKL